VASQVKNQMIIEALGDWFVVKHGVSMRQVNPNKASKEKTTIICSYIIKTTHDSFKGTLTNLSHLRQVMIQQKLLSI
jgi:hydrogenase maturation factor